jgi:hypothetical protein
MGQIGPQSSVCGQRQIVGLSQGLVFPLWHRIRYALTLAKTENIVVFNSGLVEEA